MVEGISSFYTYNSSTLGEVDGNKGPVDVDLDGGGGCSSLHQKMSAIFPKASSWSLMPAGMA